MKSVFTSYHLVALPMFWAAMGLSAPALAQNSGALEADEVFLDDKSGRVEATGNVEISNGEAWLQTQKLFLNRTQKTVTVPQELVLRQADGTRITAQSAALNSQLDTGTLTKINVTLPQAGRMSAASARQAPDALTLETARFTACDECPDPEDAPLWQIRAGEIHYDRVGQNIIYKHPRLEVYGVPVFYLPYMAHAGPEVERRSGFLAPRFAGSGDFGAAVETPYFIDLAPNYDLTLTPRVSEFQDPFLTGEWRHLTAYGSYELTAYAHSPSNELREDTERETRFGIVGAGQFQLADWQLDFAIEDASDDIFFKRYDINDTNRLTNHVKLSRDFANQSLTLETYSFRNTLQAEQAATVDTILPSLTQEIFFDSEIFGGSLSMVNRLTHEQRALGTDITHLASQLDWNWQHTTQGGFVLSARNRLAMDAYNYDPLDGQDIEADELFAANATAFTLAYPLQRVRANTTQLLTPRAQIVLATENEKYDAIPYIGGASIDLSRAQLFNPLATKDEASRVNLGLAHELNVLSALKTEIFIGQSFNLSDRDYALRSGYGEDRSALLADFAVTSGPLSLVQQARFDETDSTLLRSESTARLSFERFSLGLNHSFYEAGQNGASRLEEATANMGWRINKNWQLEATMRENLETEQRVEALARLNYEDECTLLQLSIERDYSQVAGIEANTSINLMFTLKTIGGTLAPKN